MTKPVIVTRAGKGSALTFVEGDSNFTNLQNATLTVKAGTGGTDVVSDLNGTVTLVAGTNVTLSGDNTAKTITINSSTPSLALNDLSDVNTTGVSNGQVLYYDGATSQWSTITISPGGLTNIVEDTTPQLGGTLDVNGNSINNSQGSGNITLAAGIGSNPGTLFVGTGSNTPTISGAGANGLFITSNVGGSATAYVSLTSGTNGSVELASYGSGNIDLNTTGTGKITIGKLNTNATITTKGTSDLILNTNDNQSGLSGSITIQDGANQNILISPNGSGKINLDGLLWPNADGTNGQVLTTNGSGTLSWTTASGGSSTLDGLSDVTITTPSNGHTLVYDNMTSQWINTPPNSGISQLQDDPSPTLGANLRVNGYSIVSISNGNIAITPDGSGKTQVKNLNYNEGQIYDLGTTSGTITPNVTNGNVQKITLNGNLTFSAFASPEQGQSLTLIINTNGTGRTLTSTMKFAGGEKTLSTTSTTDIISIYYDGTNYWASLSKDFK